MGLRLLEKFDNCVEKMIDSKDLAAIKKLSKKFNNNFNVDQFGFDPSIIKYILPLAIWLYRHYFRCEVHGLSNIPDKRMIVISNHSGQLPFDGLMILTAFLLEASHPTMLRGMAARWCAEIPFISWFYVRCGQVIGEVETCKRLLQRENAVIVFPEGIKGISKLYKDKYKLQQFGSGFMRLSLQTNSPIVPVAVIGAEEQAPAVLNLKYLGKMLGMPALPIILPQILPLPLPVKYHIHIGKPMIFQGCHREDDDLIASYVSDVKNCIQNMLNKQSERKSYFT